MKTEKQFMRAQRKLARLEEKRLRHVRSPVLTELELARLDKMAAKLARRLKNYDKKNNRDRKGGWFPTFSGTRFWPEDPRPQDINIEDIAHALARINRFNGHSKKCYSVAHHSVLVSRCLPRELALFGLMHDAGEAFLGDIISPLKRIFRDFYESLEGRVMAVIAEKFGFADQFADESAREGVKRGDMALLATEIRDLTNNKIATQPLTELPLDKRITVCWSPKQAEKAFLEEFETLYASRTRTPDVQVVQEAPRPETGDGIAEGGDQLGVPRPPEL